MKWLTVVLSTITLLVLLSELIVETSDAISNKEIAAVVSLLPLNQNAEKLAIEADWLIDHAKIAAGKRAKAETKNNKNNKGVIKEAVPSYPTLNIAGVDYQLLGIFKSDNLPFILLKAKKESIKKIIQGNEISSGIILKEVSATKIILDRAGKSIEFKLFEPTKHA